MLPPRQLIAFILITTCTAFSVVFINHSDDSSALSQDGTSQHSLALIGSTVVPAVTVTEYRNEGRVNTHSAEPSMIREIEPMLPEGSDALSVVEDLANWRVASATEIPFPLYPNGTRYRIGGEDGMKIALFETTDDFSAVDAFYDRQSSKSGLARKPMTQDYVKYLQPAVDDIQRASLEDVGARPGVVIHEFFNADEATSLGAAPDSRTNIIISFR